MKQHVFVHGNISASQYTLHIVLTKETGSVQFASCNCKAGLSAVMLEDYFLLLLR